MDKRHRFRAVLLSLMLLLGAIAFVALRPAPTPRLHPERTPVRFWHMWTGEWQVVVERIVTRFNQSQERYEVIALSVPPGGADQKFLLAVTGGDPPDVMAQWNQVIPSWAEHGLLEPIEGHLSAEDWATYQREAYPVARRVDLYDGHLYGVTTGLGVFACFYRTDHFTQAGIDPGTFPESLEALSEVGGRLDQRDAQGRLTRIGFLPAWLPAFLPSFGNGLWDAKAGQLTLETPANERAVALLADSWRRLGFDEVLRFQAALNTGGFATQWPFISGQYSIAVDGQWRIEQLAKYAPDLPYATALIPPPAGGVSRAGLASANFLLIPKGAKAIDGAVEFIRFWSGLDDPERAAEFATWGGWLPLLPAVTKAKAYQDYVAKYPQLRTFVDALDSDGLQSPPPIPSQTVLMDRLRRAEDRAIRGEMTPAEALRALRAEMDRELARRSTP